MRLWYPKGVTTEEFFSRQSPWPRIAWGVFLLFVLVAFAVTAGSEVASTFLATAVAMVLLSWRFPYAMLSAWVSVSFLLGIQIAVSTGYYRIGERIIGATVELSLGEVVAVGLVAAWALRVLLLWRGRHDRHWRPLVPLALPFLALALSSLLSYFGPGQPALGEVLKHIMRYQVFLYLSCITLTVNFVRSKKRLRQILASLMIVGVLFAFDGLRSMVVFDGGLPTVRQAQPQPILGMNPLSGNQHSLAELLLVAIGAALAYASLAPAHSNRKQLAEYAAVLMTAVTILTFSRTAWAVLLALASVLFATLWKDWFRTHRRRIAIGCLLALPLVGAMLAYSLTRASQGSLDARAALSGIAWTFFTGSPLVGVGAGTFADRVANTSAFVMDYGMPLDSHGMIQKIAAETGLLGLAAFVWVLVALIRYVRRDWRILPQGRAERDAYLYLAVTVLCAFLYQLTSTSYWTPRLWLPVGLLLAAGHIFREQQTARDPDFLLPSHG